MDYKSIDEQILAEKKRLDQQLADLIASQNAKIEAQRAANEQRRADAEKEQEERSKRAKELREAAQRAQLDEERARQAQIRAEENRINVMAEAKAREEQEAEALKKKILDLQFAHEQSLKALRDSFAISSHEVGSVGDVLSVAPDGTEAKPVKDNTDGTIHPLHHFRQNVNS